MPIVQMNKMPPKVSVTEGITVGLNGILQGEYVAGADDSFTFICRKCRRPLAKNVGKNQIHAPLKCEPCDLWQVSPYA